ncbi:hypothetical protein Y1Q_0007326 [Alligator mississippiensis]|uniref:ATP-dependent DNA helicase n=1 Tax=Alligator mississippiensis TaxID=8496 RepID=A0A151P7L8_ALLMI|nr:hypothetical protein Y1Q_0007326 [Alligator mississippiensis]
MILSAAHGAGNIALTVASSGIAATMLTGGRTVHSRFQVPLNVLKTSTCSISAEPDLAELIREAAIIIWDEAPMAHQYMLEAVERTLQDLLQSNLRFGGKSSPLRMDNLQLQMTQNTYSHQAREALPFLREGSSVYRRCHICCATTSP